MSTRKAIITAVTVQHLSQGEAARQFGVSKGWVSKLMTRYRAEGQAAFEPASRAPATHPNRVSDHVVAAVLAERDRLTTAGLDAGAETIRWHLATRGITASRTSIHRTLVRHRKVVPEPHKRPKSSYTRFVAALPNECWQSDFTHYPLTTGADVEIITWLDDHSRYALHLSAHTRVTGRIVRDTFTATIDEYGCPASTLTDNGMVYTLRFARKKARTGRNAFDTELARRGITQKNGRPNHPTTTGNVERFQQTLKKWLTAQPDQPATLHQLNALLARFRTLYNQERPHRGIGRRTPATAYTPLPKAVPGEPTDRTHTRVRVDKVNNGKITLRYNGQLYSIGIGRAHNATPVTALTRDLHITILATDTGEILRELTPDPTRRYQPRTPENP